LADDQLGVLREVLADPPPVPYREAFARIAASPDNLLLVAEVDGAAVGCLQLTIIPGLARQGQTRGQIEAVRIAVGHRSHGLGEQLVRAAIARARAAGCGLVQLTTDKRRTDAHRFYERLGFVASHEGMKLALK
ncbi:MAG: GNAT family N-acetyltransferase, partial [Alphaproteobacteria bacterium]|nr:GNAT family N-acetyltransferase [Alphaproteobacteria bacterium]